MSLCFTGGNTSKHLLHSTGLDLQGHYNIVLICPHHDNHVRAAVIAGRNFTEYRHDVSSDGVSSTLHRGPGKNCLCCSTTSGHIGEGGKAQRALNIRGKTHLDVFDRVSKIGYIDGNRDVRTCSYFRRWVGRGTNRVDAQVTVWHRPAHFAGAVVVKALVVRVTRCAGPVSLCTVQS